MSPVTVMHDEISGYLYLLLKAYVALNPVGIVRQALFTMKLDAVRAGREPDLMVILEGNPAKQTDTALIGPANLVIEIVSRKSEERDYVEKRREYEIAGVREYWIFDPLRNTSLIYRREGDDSYFKQVQLDADGNLTTPLMPGLKLHVPALWRMPLPDFVQVYDAVRAMLGK
jgi:Uma2 family endonuclease